VLGPLAGLPPPVPARAASEGGPAAEAGHTRTSNGEQRRLSAGWQKLGVAQLQLVCMANSCRSPAVAALVVGAWRTALHARLVTVDWHTGSYAIM
jgi:hypothetical protein